MAIILSCLVLDPSAGYFEPFPPPSAAVVGFPGPFPAMGGRAATSGWHVGGVYCKKMAAGEINRVLLYDIYAITGVTLDRTTTCKCSVFKHRRVSVGHHKMSYTALRAP